MLSNMQNGFKREKLLKLETDDDSRTSESLSRLRCEYQNKKLLSRVKHMHWFAKQRYLRRIRRVTWPILRPSRLVALP